MPLVLMIIVLLGIGAGAALFSSMGDARLDRRSAFNEMARMLAQSAVEEMLVKVTNGSDYVPDKRFTYRPYATLASAQRQGFTLDDVELMGRAVETPQNAADLATFEQLCTAGPGFAVRFEDREKDWRDEAELPDWAKQEPWSSQIIDSTGAGQAYRSTHWKEYFDRSTFDDNGAIRQAFNALEPLSDKAAAWTAAPKDVSHFAGNQVGSPDSGMTLFLEKWDAAMNAVADQVGNRIAGCDGDPSYGVGAMMAALCLGGAADANQNAEEDFRNTALNGGVLDYRADLVTAMGRASTTQGTVSVSQAVTAHRLVSRINFKVAMDKMRDNLVPYLMVHYNFTPKDFEVLGWAAIAWTSDGKVSQVVPKKELLTKLAERYPDNPNPRVAPFQAATCLTKPRS